MSRRKPPRVTGVALVDKPKGMTSHDVVQSVRRTFRQSQVGHTGTLDPAATGLLALTLGRATRLGRFLEAEAKVYEGEIALGRSTTTWDGEGETVEEMEVPPLSKAMVTQVLSQMEGPLVQEVPAFSAIKVEGERLYAKARRGEDVVLPKRTVQVSWFRLVSLSERSLQFEVRVSKGTYVRSLAVEVGRRLGTAAHLRSLRRTEVGTLRVEEATAPEDVSEAAVLTPMQALRHLPSLELDDAQVRSVGFGRPFLVEAEPGSLVRLVDGSGRLAGVGTVSDQGWIQYEVVLLKPPSPP